LINRVIGAAPAGILKLFMWKSISEIQGLVPLGARSIFFCAGLLFLYIRLKVSV